VPKEMRDVTCSSGAPTVEQLSGSERTLMLHEPDSPWDVVGPARALLLDARSFGRLSDGTSNAHPTAPQADGYVGPSESQAEAVLADGSPTASPPSKQMWLWVHAACYVRARGALERQCGAHGVQLTSRSAHWRRLELRGPRSSAVLAALLQQVVIMLATAATEHQAGSVTGARPCGHPLPVFALHDCHMFARYRAATTAVTAPCWPVGCPIHGCVAARPVWVAQQTMSQMSCPLATCQPSGPVLGLWQRH